MDHPRPASWRRTRRAALVRIVFDDSADEFLPSPASPVLAGGHDVGRITSAAYSPRVGRVLALAMVRRGR
jgi:glycine cleavage system aminomethyltransferase T